MRLRWGARRRGARGCSRGGALAPGLQLASRALLLGAQPPARPGLQLLERRLERPAHVGQLVEDLDGRARVDVSRDDTARLELLHTLGQQAVAQLGHGMRDLAEAERPAIEEDRDDRAGPAAADELDSLVVIRAAGRRTVAGGGRWATGLADGCPNLWAHGTKA